MELKVEQMSEKNMYRLIVTASSEEFEKGVQKAYEKNKGRIALPGFRKGKAPRKMIEKMYGKTFFYNDAANEVVPTLYEEAAKESGLEIVSKPALKVVEMTEEKPIVFTAEVAVKPEVELGEYKGVEVSKQDTEVTKEEVKAELEKIRNTNARVVEVKDRPVAEKDITTIDFEGFIDGVPFEGGKGTDYPLTIGSHSFIDTFEDQMIGMNISEEREIKVKFPEDYHASALKGKDAIFKVVVKEIKERQLPELDDEFAKDVSEFDTFKEYEASIKEKLEETKKIQAKNFKEREILDKVIENAKMEIPEPMVEAQVNNMIRDLEANLSKQGMNIDAYLRYMGLTKEKFLENIHPDAKKRIQQRLVLEAIAKAEKIEVSDEEYEEEIKKNAESYGIEVEELKKLLGEEGKANLLTDAAIKKALELVNSSSKEVEKKEQKEEKEAKKTTTKKSTTKSASETGAKKSTSKKAEDSSKETKTTAKKTTTKKTTTKKEEK